MATTMSEPKLKLIKIDAKDVENNPDNYNSHFHTAEEAPSFPVPTETSQQYSRWLSLIVSSQRIPSDLIQTLSLTPAQGRLLLEAADIDDSIKPTLSTLTFPTQGLFLRLDASSPKDGVKGTQPLRTVDEIILRLTTSYRAFNAITDLLSNGAEEVPLYFLPYSAKMRTDREFRVFCPPGDGKISAVSQYKWHARSIFASMSPELLESKFRKILSEIGLVHAEIMAVVEERRDELDELMLKQGFTFDLIELNSFGTRSGCGACLFHWLRDEDVLYGKMGLETGEVEFRVSV
ncbi:hypothetical protein V8E51_009686 [Hyaloscypha variabilis]